MIRKTNWAGNISFTAAAFHQPESVDELRRLVSASRLVRAIGTGHSFNSIADTAGDHVSLARLPKYVQIDSDASAVTISAGLRYGDLGRELQARGWALGNLGSLPHISVAGACATGTHGSGVGNRNLAAAVRALTFVSADGELVTLRRGDPHFDGAVISLGALGVVTDLTLDIVPAYDVEQFVYDDMPLKSVEAHLDEIMTAAYSVGIFTDWRGAAANSVWVKRRSGDAFPTTPPVTWLGATLADSPRHPIAGMSTENCTAQLGVGGPWNERLPHFRMEFTPSSGAELQTEYLVSNTHAVAALQVLAVIADRLAPLTQISEIRTVAADELWLSPSYQRASVAFHFTWVPDTPAVLALLPVIEELLAPFAARPHWGKLFTTAPAALRDLYPRIGDVEQLMLKYDEGGKFRNAYLDRLFGRP